MKNRKIFILTLLFSLSLILSGLFAECSDKWTRELSMQFKTVTSTAISPDGKWIAYVVRKPVMKGEKSEYLSHIWLVSSDGKINVQFTQGDKSCSLPAFSPDGKYLTFLSSRSGKNQIWIMRIYGGEAKQLTKAENGVIAYKWSPNGKQIAFLMRDPDTEEEKKAKKEKRDVVLIDKNFKYNYLYVIDFSFPFDSAFGEKRITKGCFSISDFDWSPDSKNIVFSHQPDPTLNTRFIESDISIAPSDSGKIVSLVKRPGIDSSPLWSPDGKLIAFTSNGGKPDPVGQVDIYIVSCSGGNPKKLADTPDRSPRLIAWSSDSKKIYFSEFVKTDVCVLSIPINGNKPSYVTGKNGVFGNVSFDKNRKHIAFTYELPELPSDVYFSSVKSLKLKKLTQINKNIKIPSMGKTVLIKWKSKDGLDVEGLLTYPVNYKEGQKYPLILNIHGGPAGAFSKRFTGGPSIYMIQYFAQHGYAIIRPNPRGSTGYGTKFRHLNVRDWGFGDFDDCMTGVDKVIDMGIGHPDSLCVMGWSYGGYMTSYVVTKTNRFKAASMGAGLPNLISMVTTTDIPDYLVAHLKGEYWDNYNVYEKHSAIYRIKNVKTPTQILHGQNDWRVPYTQGVEFYNSLKRLGVTTEMVAYPRTPHGPREPKLLMDVSYRILKWFEKNLRNKEFKEQKCCDKCKDKKK